MRHQCDLAPEAILKYRKSLEYGKEIRGLEAAMADQTQC